MTQSRTPDAVDNGSSFARRNRPFGIVVSILLIALGALLLFLPQTLLWLEFLACAGLAVYGVCQIVQFIAAPTGHRDGWKLAMGILNIIIGIFLIVAWKDSRAATAALFNGMLAFMLGMLSLMSGISKCSLYGSLKKAGNARASWMLISGILSILLAIFFFIFPFTMIFTFNIIIAVYLLVGGVALFAESCSS